MRPSGGCSPRMWPVAIFSPSRRAKPAGATCCAARWRASAPFSAASPNSLAASTASLHCPPAPPCPTTRRSSPAAPRSTASSVPSTSTTLRPGPWASPPEESRKACPSPPPGWRTAEPRGGREQLLADLTAPRKPEAMHGRRDRRQGAEAGTEEAGELGEGDRPRDGPPLRSQSQADDGAENDSA